MRKYKRETIELYVKIYFSIDKLKQSFEDVALNQGVSEPLVKKYYTECTKILNTIEHPNHDDALECYDEIKKKIPDTTPAKEKIKDSSKSIYQLHSEILNSFDNVKQMENRVAEEKFDLAMKVDKMKMPIYGQFAVILSEYFLFLNSLSKDELDTCQVNEDKIPNIDILLNKLKVLDVDVQAITTIENYLIKKEFPPFLIKFSENFIDDFNFKRRVLEELLLYMKDPENSKKSMEDFRSYTYPFGRFRL